MPSRTLRRLKSEDGAVTYIVAGMLVMLLVIAALVIDIGRQRHARQQLQDAVDMASLAATDFLPANNSELQRGAENIVRRITVASATNLPVSAVTTRFFCVLTVGTGPGDNSLNGPRPELGNDADAHACGPADDGAWDGPNGWRTNGDEFHAATTMTHDCNPSRYAPLAGDLCNAVGVSARQTVDYLLAPVIGVAGSAGGTGDVQSTACTGGCKSIKKVTVTVTRPVDVALVLDRTGSMSEDDLQNTKNAAKELLKIFDPAQQKVALLALPYPNATDTCAVQSPQEYPDVIPDYTKWLVKPLSGDYNYFNGTLSGELVDKIQCLAPAGAPTIKVAGNVSPSQSHTNLGDPMGAAGALLAATGRVGVPHVIIFMTDGQANQPWDPDRGFEAPCGYAAAKVDDAFRARADIYTIAYGVEDVRCPDRSGDYGPSPPPAKGNIATGLLADMATQPSDDDSRTAPGGCGPNENSDGDHYFCEAKSGDLSLVFQAIAKEIVDVSSTRGGRLVDAG